MPFDANNYVAADPENPGQFMAVVGGVPNRGMSQSEAENTYNRLATGGAVVTQGGGLTPPNISSGAMLGNQTIQQVRSWMASQDSRWASASDAAITAEYNKIQANKGAAQPSGMSQLAQLLGISLPESNQMNLDWSKEQYGKTLAEQQREYDLSRQLQQASQYSSLAQGLLGAATSLRGPANWLDYANYTSGGKDIFQRLWGNQPAPQFSAPTNPSQVAGIAGVLGDLGILPGNFSQTQGQQTAKPYVPLPYQINPGVWDSLSDTAKQMMLSSAEHGYTPSGAWTSTDFLNQLNASRPQGQAPRSVSYNWGQPQGAF